MRSNKSDLIQINTNGNIFNLTKDSNTTKVYIINILLLSIITIGINYLYFSEIIYFQTFGDQLVEERINILFKISKKWQWFGYALIPIVVLIRVGFTSICLYIGLFVVDLKIPFRDLFKVTLLADFVFVFAGLTKMVILIFFKDVSTLYDLQFQPLSLMELFDRESVDQLLYYPLSLVSVFELIYWLTLAWLLTEVVEKPFGSTFKTVASSYGTGLLLWVLFIMFLTVNLSQ